jgi:hypothetical protein
MLNILIIVYIQAYLNVFPEQISFRPLTLQTTQKFVYSADFINLLKLLAISQTKLLFTHRRILIILRQIAFRPLTLQVCLEICRPLRL